MFRRLDVVPETAAGEPLSVAIPDVVVDVRQPLSNVRAASATFYALSVAMLRTDAHDPVRRDGEFRLPTHIEHPHTSTRHAQGTHAMLLGGARRSSDHQLYVVP